MCNQFFAENSLIFCFIISILTKNDGFCYPLPAACPAWLRHVFKRQAEGESYCEYNVSLELVFLVQDKNIYCAILVTYVNNTKISGKSRAHISVKENNFVPNVSTVMSQLSRFLWEIKIVTITGFFETCLALCYGLSHFHGLYSKRPINLNQ